MLKGWDTARRPADAALRGGDEPHDQGQTAEHQAEEPHAGGDEHHGVVGSGEHAAVRADERLLGVELITGVAPDPVADVDGHPTTLQNASPAGHGRWASHPKGVDPGAVIEAMLALVPRGPSAVAVRRHLLRVLAGVTFRADDEQWRSWHELAVVVGTYLVDPTEQWQRDVAALLPVAPLTPTTMAAELVAAGWQCAGHGWWRRSRFAPSATLGDAHRRMREAWFHAEGGQ